MRRQLLWRLVIVPVAALLVEVLVRLIIWVAG